MTIVDDFIAAAERPHVPQPLLLSQSRYERVKHLLDGSGIPYIVSEPPDEPEPDPIAEVIESRRRRGPHGPQTTRRAPRRLDPSRRR